jgi:hypothetical protein
MKTAEIKVVRNVDGYTVMECTKNTTIRNILELNHAIRNNISPWIRHVKKKKWNFLVHLDSGLYWPS